MYAEERRQAIAQTARRDGRVEVAELARIFEVTPETVRRDLSDLEGRGVLQRVHGGAIAIDRLRHEPAISERRSARAAEKRRIAAAALSYVPTEGTILLDAGTTTGALATLLPRDRRLTVITNSLPIAMALSAHTNLELLVLGGRIRGSTLAAVDDWPLRTLADLSVDIAFIGSNGVSVERGLTTPDPAEAAVKREFVRCGRQSVALVDHQKIGRDYFVRFARLDELDVLITDAGGDPAARTGLEESGVEVVIA